MPGLAWTTYISIRPLTAVVIDEDVCGTALQLVRRNRVLDRLHSGLDDSMQALFVDWHLNSHVRQLAVHIAMKAPWGLCRVILAVVFHRMERSAALRHIDDEGLEEELGRVSEPLMLPLVDELTRANHPWAGRVRANSIRNQFGL